MRKIISTVVFIVCAASTAWAVGLGGERRAFLIDSISDELPAAGTAADSVTMLFNLFDLSLGEEQINVGAKLLRTVLGTADAEMKFNVLRRYGEALAAAPDNKGPEIEELIDIVMTLPEGSERSNTVTFLEVQKVINDFATLPDSEKQERVHQAIRRRTLGTDDQYEDVVLLYTLASYMSGNTPGDLVIDYLDQLHNQIRALPVRSYALENMFLEQAAVIYTRAGLYKEAVKISKEHLKVIADLERANQKANYKYRDYSNTYYHIYLRLLNNFEALTPEEIDDYYAKMCYLAAEDPEISQNDAAAGRRDIYYLMGKKQYASAIALLKKHVAYPENEPHLSSLYQFMMEAAIALGDKTTQLEAAIGINDVLSRAIEEHRQERKQEIMIFKELINMQNERAISAQEQIRLSAEHHRNLISYGSIVLTVLVIITLFIFWLYRRIRLMRNKLAQSNDMLRAERDNLRRTQSDLIKARDHARKADRHKTEFINNMSHEVREPLESLVECAHLIADNVEPDKRRYLDKYARIIDICSDMLMAFVNDVLLMAEADNSDLEVNKKHESANTICELAVMSMRKFCKEGVTMDFVRNEGVDVMVNTDARRVEQVLINLLSNAAKFTEQGKIELSYAVSPDDGTISFAVSDTGIGIPRGKEEIIFERFEKLSSLSQGSGLGLNICRMVSAALGGTVKVDTTYESSGSRFIFTIPVA